MVEQPKPEDSPFDAGTPLAGQKNVESNRQWISLGLIATPVMIGWLLLAFLRPNGPGEVAGGLLLGTMFGQVTLAAAWTALGPFSLIRRLPLAFAWLAAVSIAIAINIASDSGSDLTQVLVICGAMLVQWILVQGPLWLLVIVFRLRIRHRREASGFDDASDVQFGIRQVMTLTALVAVVLGACRMLLGGLQLEVGGNDWWEGCLLFGFIVLTNCVVSLPLLAAALLPQHAIPASVGALVFVALATLLEVPLFNRILQGLGPGGPRENYVLFFVLNLVQCTWVLGPIAVLRWGGFGINSPRSDARALGSKGMS